MVAWIKAERLIVKSAIKYETTYNREEEATKTTADEIIEGRKPRALGEFRETSLKSITEWNEIKSGLKMYEGAREPNARRMGL